MVCPITGANRLRQLPAMSPVDGAISLSRTKNICQFAQIKPARVMSELQIFSSLMVAENAIFPTSKPTSELVQKGQITFGRSETNSELDNTRSRPWGVSAIGISLCAEEPSFPPAVYLAKDFF